MNRKLAMYSVALLLGDISTMSLHLSEADILRIEQKAQARQLAKEQEEREMNAMMASLSVCKEPYYDKTEFLPKLGLSKSVRTTESASCARVNVDLRIAIWTATRAAHPS